MSTMSWVARSHRWHAQGKAPVFDRTRRAAAK